MLHLYGLARKRDSTCQRPLHVGSCWRQAVLPSSPACPLTGVPSRLRQPGVGCWVPLRSVNAVHDATAARNAHVPEFQSLFASQAEAC